MADPKTETKTDIAPVAMGSTDSPPIDHPTHEHPRVNPHPHTQSHPHPDPSDPLSPDPSAIDQQSHHSRHSQSQHSQHSQHTQHTQPDHPEHPEHPEHQQHPNHPQPQPQNPPSSSPSLPSSTRRASHFRIRQRLASWHQTSDSKQSKNTDDQQPTPTATPTPTSTPASKAKKDKDETTASGIMPIKSASNNNNNHPNSGMNTGSHFNQKLKNFFRINSNSEKDHHKDHKEKSLDNLKSDNKSAFRQSRKFFTSVGRLRSTTTASEGNPLDESLSPTAHANPYFAHQGLPNLRHHNEGSVPPSPPDTPSLKIHHVDGGKEQVTSQTKEELARKLRRVASAPNAQGLFNSDKGGDERPATAELGKEPLVQDPGSTGLEFAESKSAMANTRTLSVPDQDGLGALPSPGRNSLLNFRRTYSSNSIKVRNVEVSPASFDKIKLIGKGDVGKVYLVREKKSSRLYAMKGERRGFFFVS